MPPMRDVSGPVTHTLTHIKEFSKTIQVLSKLVLAWAEDRATCGNRLERRRRGQEKRLDDIPVPVQFNLRSDWRQSGKSIGYSLELQSILRV